MIIPFLPNPLPDELLGSWLARVKLHNGDRWWKNFIAQAGYQTFQRSLVRIPDYDVRLNKLLGLLGMSFRTALLEHTHLPYIMAFEGVQHAGLEKPGPASDRMDPSPPGSKNQVRDRGAWSEAPQYCPECLAEAFVEAEPFWRVSHQLPNVAYCSKHETLLLRSCPSCQVVVAGDPTQLMRPLPVICSCGHALKSRLFPSPAEPQLHRNIRRLSLQAMRQPPSRWSTAQMRSYVSSLVEATGAPDYVTSLEHPEDDYQSAILDEYVKLAHQETGLTIVLRRKIRKAKAPDFCAVMAMHERTFEEDARLIAESDFSAAHEEDPVMLREAMEGRLAYDVHLWRCKLGISPLALDSYWYFRILDPGYLGTYPDLRNKALPTIDEDRSELLRKLNGGCRASKYFDTYLKRSSPLRMRMLLQDGKWLQAVREEFEASPIARTVDSTQKRARSPSSRPKRHLAAVFDERCERMRQAIDTLSSQVPPTWITALAIAQQAQLTARTVHRVLANDETLSNMFKAWNDTWLEAACDWAIDQLLVEGGSVNASSILRRAKLADKRRAAAQKQIQKRLGLFQLQLHGPGLSLTTRPEELQAQPEAADGFIPSATLITENEKADMPRH